MFEREFDEIQRDGRCIAVYDVATGYVYPMVAGGDDAEDAKKDEDSNKDADGNVGKLKDEGTARAGAVDDAKDDEDPGDEEDQDAADSGAKIPGKRFQRVIKQRNEARAKLDAATARSAERDAKLARYERYEAEIAVEEQARVDAENAAKGIPSREEQNARWDALLEQRYGPGAAQDFEAQRETRQMELGRLVREGHAHLRTLLTEHGMGKEATTGEGFDYWDRQIGAALRSTPDRVAKFKDPRTQMEAIDEAFDEIKKHVVDPSVAAASSGRIKALARRRAQAPSSGGSNNAPDVDVTPTKPPKDLTDPRKRATWWERHIESRAREMDAQDEDNR